MLTCIKNEVTRRIVNQYGSEIKTYTIPYDDIITNYITHQRSTFTGMEPNNIIEELTQDVETSISKYIEKAKKNGKDQHSLFASVKQKFEKKENIAETPKLETYVNVLTEKFDKELYIY